MRSVLVVIGLVTGSVLVSGCGLLGVQPNTSATPTESPRIPRLNLDDLGEGFVYGNRERTLAYSTVAKDASAAPCPAEGGCGQIAVVSATACIGGIRVTFSDLSSEGIVIGSSAGTSGPTKAFEIAAIGFRASSREADEFRVAKMECLS